MLKAEARLQDGSCCLTKKHSLEFLLKQEFDHTNIKILIPNKITTTKINDCPHTIPYLCAFNKSVHLNGAR